jgi:sarcosine oxidase subunit gamma
MNASATLPDPQSVLRLADLSHRPRFGCKGPGAGRWLADHGYSVPHASNTWKLGPEGVLVGRLGTGEFLVEAISGGDDRVQASDLELMSLSTVSAGVYWVGRQDKVLRLSGECAHELLLECCSFNFRELTGSLDVAGGPLVLTSMIGVAVVVVPEPHGGSTRFTFWCDPSFGTYLSSTLLELIHGRGGGIAARAE